MPSSHAIAAALAASAFSSKKPASAPRPGLQPQNGSAPSGTNAEPPAALPAAAIAARQPAGPRCPPGAEWPRPMLQCLPPPCSHLRKMTAAVSCRAGLCLRGQRAEGFKKTRAARNHDEPADEADSRVGARDRHRRKRRPAARQDDELAASSRSRGRQTYCGKVLVGCNLLVSKLKTAAVAIAWRGPLPPATANRRPGSEAQPQPSARYGMSGSCSHFAPVPATAPRRPRQQRGGKGAAAAQHSSSK